MAAVSNQPVTTCSRCAQPLTDGPRIRGRILYYPQWPADAGTPTRYNWGMCPACTENFTEWMRNGRPPKQHE